MVFDSLSCLSATGKQIGGMVMDGYDNSRDTSQINDTHSMSKKFIEVFGTPFYLLLIPVTHNIIQICDYFRRDTENNPNAIKKKDALPEVSCISTQQKVTWRTDNYPINLTHLKVSNYFSRNK